VCVCASQNEEDLALLSDLGVIFLLFEMGLELNTARLQALAKYAFGLGLAQILLSTAAFAAFELPVGNAFGSNLLMNLFGAPRDIVDIRTVDEALVIGAALSLSSSAFVLQLLGERGERGTRFGAATLGILLMQDIAVVPLLVLLPLYEGMHSSGVADAMTMAAATPSTADLLQRGAVALLGLGLVAGVSKLLLRRVFDLIASTSSEEAFVALCLLSVTGTSFATKELGFSDTLGAFLAGAVLAETNYRKQVEKDIKPFRGLLLALFFVTTGTSIDLELLAQQWPNVLALLAGLIVIKTAIVALAGPFVGLSRAESVRTGLLLSQGGEFAFVLLSLAEELEVLPGVTNRLLIIVVVLSMALTPVLAELGEKAYVLLDGGDAAAEAEAAAAAARKEAKKKAIKAAKAVEAAEAAAAVALELELELAAAGEVLTDAEFEGEDLRTVGDCAECCLTDDELGGDFVVTAAAADAAAAAAAAAAANDDAAAAD